MTSIDTASRPLESTAVPSQEQVQRVAGAAHEAVLHDQLYRYAEDLEMMIERHGTLENHLDRLRETCNHLTLSRNMLEDLIYSSRDIHIVTDPEGTILQCNPASRAIAAPQRITGYNLGDWTLPAYRPHFKALRARALEDTIPNETDWELRLRREDPEASPLIVLVQVLPVRKDGLLNSLHWILRDVTRQREVEFETEVSSMVFRHATEGVMITDINGEIMAVNPAFTRITGYSAVEAVGRPANMLNSGIQDAKFYADFWRSLNETGRWQGRIYNRKKDGEIYPEWLAVSSVRDKDNRTLSHIGVFSDLSRLLQVEKELADLAHHDSLTGLPNRLLFQDRLTHALHQSERTGTPFTLIFIDLDHFKPINDRHGHDVGDRVLQETAQRLKTAVRKADTVARFGGDEFVILASSLGEDSDIDRYCQKLLEQISAPLAVDNLDLQVGGSLGCAVFPRHGTDDKRLLKHADIAMYRAKASGGNCHAIYLPVPPPATIAVVLIPADESLKEE
jgi:diguanylate cyclase (GGDEF)-like protein/PAS domain S-box-containing protein